MNESLTRYGFSTVSVLHPPPHTTFSSNWFVWFHPFPVLPLVFTSAALSVIFPPCLVLLCPLLIWWPLSLSDLSSHFQLFLPHSVATSNHCSLHWPPALLNLLIYESLRGRPLKGLEPALEMIWSNPLRPRKGAQITHSHRTTEHESQTKPRHPDCWLHLLIFWERSVFIWYLPTIVRSVCWFYMLLLTSLLYWVLKIERRIKYCLCL